MMTPIAREAPAWASSERFLNRSDSFLTRLGDQSADLIHIDFAHVARDDLEGGVESIGPAQVDRLLQLGELAVDQRRDRIEPALLLRIVDGDGAKLVEVFLMSTSADW